MPAIPGRSGPYLAVVLKLVVVPIVLGGLAVEVARERWFGSFSIDPGMLVAALVVNQAALLLFAARMRSSLRIFGMTLGLVPALRIHLQSVFYFFALPMTIGLEVARFAKIRALLGGEAPAAELTYALIADRVIGALAAIVIAAALLPLVGFSGIRWQSVGNWLPWAAVALLLLVLAMAHASVRAHAAELLKAIRSGHRSVWASFGLAAATHCCFGLAIYLAANGAGIPIGLLPTLLAVCAAMLFVVVPISFAGVSPVEAANLAVLLGMGMPVEQAGLFAFLVYLAKLVAAIEGAAWEIGEGGSGFLTLARAPPEAPKL